MPRNTSKQARKERRERALDRAQWTLGQYIAGIFRPNQNINYNPLFNPDACIEKTRVTIANTLRNLGKHPQQQRQTEKAQHFALQYGTPIPR